MSAAGLSPIDTAHNTVLSILVSGGLLRPVSGGGALWRWPCARRKTHGAAAGWRWRRRSLVWVVTSLVATVEESRTTWLLLALIALAGRLAVEEPEGLQLVSRTGAACSAEADPERSL